MNAVVWPPQGIFVKKEITSAADLKGVKWRACSPATARIGDLVGAQPVTVPQSELSRAMATGAIESYMSSGSTGYDTQVWLPKNGMKKMSEGFGLFPMRKALDFLYDSAAALAALCMVGLLVMVLLSIAGRQLHLNIPGTDAYAGCPGTWPNGSARWACPSSS